MTSAATDGSGFAAVDGLGHRQIADEGDGVEERGEENQIGDHTVENRSDTGHGMSSWLHCVLKTSTRLNGDLSIIRRPRERSCIIRSTDRVNSQAQCAIVRPRTDGLDHVAIGGDA